ncbi:hypothetical protein FKR81_05630 [Lentzea tibetensis]|uniref:Uncharacterized protein n=1 Tax=Lentzea tibetensis TaxID=2591470 RepID=A0A563F0C9_9PSEU|nr:hypothetical protein [Lentzea tibetensis]TWP53437.1 hypothetical protein FKR81_05630 [Lentzea tibetensis]
MIRLFALLAVLVTACGPVTSFQAPSHVPSAPTSAPILVRQVPGDGAPARYGSTATYDACSQLSVDGRRTGREHRHLYASFSMWDKEEAATGGNAYSCDPADDHQFAPPVAVSPSIGTGNTCMSSLNNNWALTFQHNKVNVSPRHKLSRPLSPGESDRVFLVGKV